MTDGVLAARKPKVAALVSAPRASLRDIAHVTNLSSEDLNSHKPASPRFRGPLTPFTKPEPTTHTSERYNFSSPTPSFLTASMGYAKDEKVSRDKSPRSPKLPSLPYSKNPSPSPRRHSGVLAPGPITPPPPQESEEVAPDIDTPPLRRHVFPPTPFPSNPPSAVSSVYSLAQLQVWLGII